MQLHHACHHVAGARPASSPSCGLLTTPASARCMQTARSAWPVQMVRLAQDLQNTIDYCNLQNARLTRYMAVGGVCAAQRHLPRMAPRWHQHHGGLRGWAAGSGGHAGQAGVHEVSITKHGAMLHSATPLVLSRQALAAPVVVSLQWSPTRTSSEDGPAPVVACACSDARCAHCRASSRGIWVLRRRLCLLPQHADGPPVVVNAGRTLTKVAWSPQGDLLALVGPGTAQMQVASRTGARGAVKFVQEFNA